MAEFPGLGEHCGFSECKQLDFLPMKCDACQKVLCSAHITYVAHQCSSSYKKDVQVPVCPLCNQPVPVSRGETPDLRVSQHIDRDCRSDPAVAKRRIYQNRCSLDGCKVKELVPVICGDCRLNFCLKHRHTTDHDCKGFQGSGRPVSNAAISAMARQKAKQKDVKGTTRATVNAHVQGTMTEDEALAKALQMSLIDGQNDISQEEADRCMAEQLQNTEFQRDHPPPPPRRHGRTDRCTMG